MSKRIDEAKEKNYETREHLPYWMSELLKMCDEAMEKQPQPSSTRDNPTKSKK
ncbi:MAG: hypothetical protein ABSA11_13875 [Candidatus Bathyarchaeia archaeon]|jgi:hypothetical protein